MTDAEALLAAVLAHPDEDAPRLMYADAIQYEWPERAELIRVQCDLARLAGHLTPDAVEARNDLVARESQLLKAIGPARICDLTWWVGREPVGLFPLARPPSAPIGTFVRGFIERVWATWEQWLVVEKQLRAEQPLRTVRFPEWPTAHVRFEPQCYATRVSVQGIEATELIPETSLVGASANLPGLVMAAVERLVRGRWPGLSFVVRSPAAR